MGRKWGKTTGCLIAVVDGHGPGGKFRGAARGANGLWAAPTAGIAADVWRDLKASTREAWVDKSEVERRIVLPGGGSVTVRSADNPDSLRGPNYDFVVLDEAAFCHEDAWGLVLRPTLAATGGWSMFISTPCGQNWFWKKFNDCADDPDWQRWQCPTSDNPRISKAELEATLRDQGSFKFAQEHLAEFMVPGGNMFKREQVKRYSLLEGVYGFGDGTFSRAEIMARWITVDTATSEREKTKSDFTCVAAWGLSRLGRLVLLDVVMDRMEAPEIVRVIEKVTARWTFGTNRCVPYVEETTQSRHLIQFMRDSGLLLRTVEPGARDKVMRAASAQGMCESGRLWLPEAASWLADVERQLFAFYTPKAHDDFVDCLSYAVEVMLAEIRPDEVVAPAPRARAYSPPGYAPSGDGYPSVGSAGARHDPFA